MDPFFSSSPLPPLPNFPPPILNMDETPSPASADVTSNLSPIFSLLKSGWSADETSTWVDKLHNLLRKNRIFVPQDLLLFKDKAMQAVYIAITGEMEFQVIDHVKWNRLLASIPPLASAAAPLTAVHLIRETTIKPAAATVAPAQLQPVTRDAFVKRLIDFCPLLPTIADYIRDLLLIRDESTLGFNLRPQTHFYHQSGAESVNFRCVCVDLATSCKCEKAVLWSSASSHATSPSITWNCANHSHRLLPKIRSVSARLKQSSLQHRLHVRLRLSRVKQIFLFLTL